MKSSVIVPHLVKFYIKYFYGPRMGDHFKEDGIGGAWDKHGGEEKHMYEFSWKTSRKGIDVRIMLQRIFKKLDGWVWTGFIWFL